ncbi:thymocyte nuclear protein 1 isoform X1 [Osmerus eperlanus]|uniref:thymocyte nuclear protein 1 isoform X1 n=1 Tax=Osmerus eperlanus TaxID=29151 RepID=UPI002E1321AF
MPPKKRTRGNGNARTTKSRDNEQAVNDGQVEDSPSEEPGSRVRGKRKASTCEMPKKNVSTKEPTSRPQYCHWLMKSEPDSRFENGIDVKFGIEDLKAQPNQTGCWDGVRNYQARNFMRDMKEGQLAFFYHSNCKEPGVAGLMKVVKEAYVDHTQFDKKDVHYDPSSTVDNPKWSMVDVHFERMMKRFVPLSELKKYHQQHKAKGGPLKDMSLFTRARLSVQPLTTEEFDFVLSLENQERS